jgi:hypothetical protein
MTGALAGGGPVAPPGSDEMRRIACGILGRPGFTEARAEAEAVLARKDPRFVL